MELRIICLGKIKNKNLSNLINEYINKIKNFINISIIELNEITYDSEDQWTINLILEKEAKLIKPYLVNSFNIALVIEGQMYDSLTFSNKINQVLCLYSHFKYLNFIIGSSYGLDNEIKQLCQLNFSLGKITLNHQLTRLIILEQIYRAFCIINHIKYHK